jgi:hypothetical protein
MVGAAGLPPSTGGSAVAGAGGTTVNGSGGLSGGAPSSGGGGSSGAGGASTRVPMFQKTRCVDPSQVKAGTEINVIQEAG